jgi:decaprenyl-phosphate phosphoribosyltransferase
MKYYIKLLRPKDWAKNGFLFIPFFFAGELFDFHKIELLLLGFAAFCCMASSIYIINDYRDIEDDKKHPVKRLRPLASGKVKKSHAIVICILLFAVANVLAWLANPIWVFNIILLMYFVVNLGYSFGLKNIAILDILLLAMGFVFRVKGGATIAAVDTSQWLIIMTFLLALFMALAKRRDDLVLKAETGTEMRKSMKGYNLDFLNTMLGLFAAIIIVAYINYTVAPSTIERLGTYRLYYSSVFVIAGIMRYLQITFVVKKSGSPTEILYKDRFIQITLVLWIISIFTLLYLRHVTTFNT